MRFSDIRAVAEEYLNPFGVPRIDLLEKKTKKGLQYAIYLPPNFDASKTYNLLLHLHGAAAAYFCMIRDVKLTGKLLEDHSVDDMIVVAPHDPTKFSYWVDGNKIDMGTQIRDDLIPAIKSEYTIDKQFIQGFSMGGFGAAVHGHRFDATVLWDGAVHDWETLTALHPQWPIAQNTFGMDETKFTSPYKVDPPRKLLFFPGSLPELRALGMKYHQYLEEKAIDHGHHPTEQPHSYKRLVTNHFDQAVQFWKEASKSS